MNLPLSNLEVDTLLMALEFAITSRASCLKEYETIDSEILVAKLEKFCLDTEGGNYSLVPTK